MDFFDLVNISERFMEIVNPLSAEKVVRVGAFLGLHERSRVIDFGCGYAEPLALWAEHFGISGVGIDVREHACERARRKIAERGLDRQLEVIHGRGSEYPFEEGAYDVAFCLGASFIWGGFEPAIRALRRAVGPAGHVVIGEPYRTTDDVPQAYADTIPEVLTEIELLEAVHRAGLELEYVVRSSRDEWDAYEAGNWHGLLAWLRENPDHPERADVVRRLREVQDEYLRYGRQHLGWAVYVLTPMSS